MQKKKNLEELRDLFKSLPDDKKLLAEKLLDRAIFMSNVLDELEKHIGEHQSIEYFVQGAQKMWRESPALKSYNTTIKNYNGTINQIVNMLPTVENEPKDELFNFMKKGSELRAK